MSRGPDVIGTLIGPVGFEEFASRWQEQAPLHVARDDRQHFADLASVEAIEQMLSVQSLSFPDVQLSRAADPVVPDTYTDGNDRILPVRLLEHHAQGATIVVSRAQHHVPALADLCRRLEGRLGVSCQANLYLSPAGRQGFAPHYDAHDVFILQIAGAKRFTFYEGGPTLPLASDRFDASRTPAGAKSLDLLLDAGSTLYIPRGVMHDAIAEADRPSLHVTIGTFAPTALDVLHYALDRAAQDDVRLRRAIDRDTALDATALRDTLAGMLDEQSLHGALSGLRDKTALAARVDVDGLSDRLDRSRQLDEASTLRIRDDVLWGLERHGETLHVRSAGAVLDCQGALADAVAALIDARDLTVGMLPAGDFAQRLALAQRLVAENLVDVLAD